MKTPLGRLGLGRIASMLAFLILPGLLSAQTLTHRYSFAIDASDSVGGANGTIVAPKSGPPASINNGLFLPGNAGGGNGISGYVALPNGIVSGDSNVTVECWVAPSSVNTWAEIWDFGTSGSLNFALIQDSPGSAGQMRVAFTPHGNEVDILAPNGDLPVSATPIYVAVTYNNSTLVADLYTNAILDGTVVLPNTGYSPGGYGGVGGTTENTLGNDVFGDPQFGGTIYEFRIWNGVVSQRYIGAQAIAGSSVLVTNLTPASASLTTTNSMVATGTQQGVINVTLAASGSSELLATSDATNWLSSNTNILKVNASGLITAVGPGTATISATVAGVQATSAGITVVPLFLAHRYSFATDATDSIGGANGTLVAPTGATGLAAGISNGLFLPGNTVGGNGYSGYLSLPAGILLGTSSLSVEIWATENVPDVWAELWDFGNNGNQNFALIPYPANNNHDMSVAFTPNGGEHDLTTASLFPTNAEQYVCLSYNNSTLTGSLYTNGALDATTVMPSTAYAPGNIGGATGTVSNMIGNDVYGDQQFNGTVYEFRIWNGAVSALYTAVSAAAGPGKVVSNLTPSSLTLTFPSNSIEGTQTEQGVIVGNFADASGVAVTGGATNWTSSNTNAATVNSSGLITGITVGNAAISATVDGVVVTSGTITISVSPPSITQQPSAGPAVVTEPLTLSVTAIGGQLSYQWDDNGVPIPGATNSTLSFASLSLTNTGAYTVVVSNFLGMKTGGPVNVQVQSSILQHRYSFVSDASDSVGGPAWNGTLLPGSSGVQPAAISNGLILPGNPGGGNGVSGYVALPNGIVAGDTSVSVECWVLPSSVNTWAEIWDFGSSGALNFALIQDSPGPGNMRVAFTPHGNEVDIMAPTYLGTGTEAYIAVSYDNNALQGILYSNGIVNSSVALPDTTYSPGTYGGAAGTTGNSFGNDVYGDAQFGGTIYEVRIYNGVITPLQVALDNILGPTNLLTNVSPSTVTVTVSNSSLSVGQSESATVTGTFAQTGSAVIPLNSSVTTWSSSNPNVFTVNASGLITAVGAGSATVSATVNGTVGTSASINIVGTPTVTGEPPASVELLAGQTFNVSVSGAGAPPLTYSWYFNNSVTPISGATASTLTMPNVQAGNSGSYTVIISNSSGTATSSPTVLTVVAATPYQTSLLALGPLGYWPLNEASGATAFDLAGGDNGTYVGNVALGQPGVPNAAFGGSSASALFDGTTAYVDIPEGPFNITGAITVMAWASVQSYPNFAGLIGHGDPSWRISVNGSGQPGGNDGNLGSPDATDPTSIVDGAWHFIVYTYSGILGSQNGILYVDGVQVANDSIGQTPTGDALDVWIAGAPDYGTQRLLNAYIAHAAIFNKALSAADISALFATQPILGIAQSGKSITLTWASGSLLQAPSLLGPWTTNTTAVSPYTVPATNTSEFYKVQE
ncbi:MAG TPA: LamG-like jellyroll fold domain-containing protein [Verrucomicrobiae bacterium]